MRIIEITFELLYHYTIQNLGVRGGGESIEINTFI